MKAFIYIIFQPKKKLKHKKWPAGWNTPKFRPPFCSTHGTGWEGRVFCLWRASYPQDMASNTLATLVDCQICKCIISYNNNQIHFL